MNPLYSEIEQEINALHLKKAQELLNQIPEHIRLENPYVYWMFQSRIDRGQYAYSKAITSARKGLEHAQSSAEKLYARTELAKGLFSSGKISEALEMMEKVCSHEDVTLVSLLAWAFMLVETGRLQEAADPLEIISNAMRKWLIPDLVSLSISESVPAALSSDPLSFDSSCVNVSSHNRISSSPSQTENLKKAEVVKGTRPNDQDHTCEMKKADHTAPGETDADMDSILAVNTRKESTGNEAGLEQTDRKTSGLSEPFESKNGTGIAVDVKDLRLDLDACVLLGDYHSFCENYSLASFWYQVCMNILDHLPDCSWVRLRRALLLNNWGDLFEQQDSYQKACEYYQKALDLLDQHSIQDLSDSSAYILELLFAMANVYANMDQETRAMEYIHQIEEIMKVRPPRQKEVFQARLLYMRGLLQLYMDTDDSLQQARTSLQEAYRLQLNLYAKGLVKLEHIGKSAYYLASSLPADPAYEMVHQSLLEKALEIFMQVKEKEPSFYLSGIAEIENDLGTEWLGKNPDRSIFYYQNALKDYEAYTRRYPSDALTRESLLYVEMNLAGAYAAKGNREQEELVLRSLLSRMETFKQDWPELYPVLSMLAGRIRKMGSLPENIIQKAAALEDMLNDEVLKA